MTILLYQGVFSNFLALKEMPYPDLPQVKADFKKAKKALREAGVPTGLISSIETKALRTGRKMTGDHATNRHSRWAISPANPQYSTERDARIIFIKLAAMLFEFNNAPPIEGEIKQMFEQYIGKTIIPNSYKDALLLEHLDYDVIYNGTLNPVPGHGVYHLGHQDPTIVPRHVPDNVAWRTSRSNLIQGNMTLRQSRIYLIKLIGRYFELGELEII